MDSLNLNSRNFLSSVLLLSALAFLLCIPKAGYANAVSTEKAEVTTAQPMQLAHNGRRHWHGNRHWRGRHWNRGYNPYGYIYYGPGINRYYWGGWYDFYRGGVYCKKQCLRSRRTGNIIRCRVRCY